MDYGISGLTRHSLRKLAVTWGDGSARYFLRTGENDRVQPLTLLDSEHHWNTLILLIMYIQHIFIPDVLVPKLKAAGVFLIQQEY